MNCKGGKWAKEIIELQQSDGTWGRYFHSLSQPTKNYQLTTEQALRRLWILGFTIHDVPIRKAVDCMTSCLRGERKIDDYWEKTHNWELFTRMMLSTWVKVFEPDNEIALTFAQQWAEVIEKTFTGGAYNHDAYVNAYISKFNSKPNGAREIDFTSFYQMSLLQGVLTPDTENRMLDYVISKPDGIYYIYGNPLNKLPEVFASKDANRYLNALEILAGFSMAKKKLGFAIEWLNANKDINGQWDFGAKASDGVYFPLSDSWRKAEHRRTDCTKRVTTFLQILGA